MRVSVIVWIQTIICEDASGENVAIDETPPDDASEISRLASDPSVASTLVAVSVQGGSKNSKPLYRDRYFKS